MTIAPPDPSERIRETHTQGNPSFGEPYVFKPFSFTWDSIDLHARATLFADEVTATPVSTPMTVDEIAALFPHTQFVDIAPSDNETTYIEWETSDGFVSLEVGHTDFAFSYIPNDNSPQESYGKGGALTQRDLVASLIGKHS